MSPFEIIADPTRRRILELLARRDHSSGELVALVGGAFGISQPAVSQHLKALRDAGFATVRADGQRRVYALDAEPMAIVDRWLDHFRVHWDVRLDALETEIARGKKQRRQAAQEGASAVSRKPRQTRSA